MPVSSVSSGVVVLKGGTLRGQMWLRLRPQR